VADDLLFINAGIQSIDFKPPIIQAVVAEEEEEERTGVTDQYGLLISTTTGEPLTTTVANKKDDKDDTIIRTAAQSQVVDIQQATNVNGPLILDDVKELQKLPRGADDDVNDLLEIQVLTSSPTTTDTPEGIVVTMTDPSDKPGSILTTLIDGFLLQKQPKDDLVEEDKTASINAETTTTNSGRFPVTDILSGIYNLVSSYIKDDDVVDDLVDEEPFTAIPQNAINVHNMPRDQLYVEAAAAAAPPLPLDAPTEDPTGQSAPPLPFLPGKFLRGAPRLDKPQQPSRFTQDLSRPLLILNEGGNGGTREPVSIPLPNLIALEDPRSFDAVESIRTSDRHFQQ
jgi:hypothetical protein